MVSRDLLADPVRLLCFEKSTTYTLWVQLKKSTPLSTVMTFIRVGNGLLYIELGLRRAKMFFYGGNLGVRGGLPNTTR